MKVQFSSKNLIRVVSILIAVAVMLSIVPAAYAEGEGPLTPIPGLGRLPNATLVLMHKKVGGWLIDQEALFADASSLSASFQTLIDAEAKAGKNVTSLQDALITFDSELITSREINTLAGITIFSLTGWKADGNVRERLAAGQSLLDGRVQLKDANFRLTNAMATLRKSFVLWRAARIKN
jgi:hypothetical protein